MLQRGHDMPVLDQTARTLRRERALRELPDANKLAPGGASVSTKLTSMWHDMVRNYSRTALTFETDRLVAFDGIAQYMRPQRSGDYLAGLWSESLGPDLLWNAWGDGRKSPQAEPQGMTPWSSDKWLFPTWSWASIRGAVDWSQTTLHEAPSENAFLVKYMGARFSKRNRICAESSRIQAQAVRDPRPKHPAGHKQHTVSSPSQVQLLSRRRQPGARSWSRGQGVLLAGIPQPQRSCQT